MEEIYTVWLTTVSWPYLFLLIAFWLAALGKSADRLVVEAVSLSERWGVPKVVVGATVVSLGTTTPEAAVSVLAATHGDPSLALGNAVGSIICDTGLVLGIACVIAPLPLPPKILQRQGWLQLGCALLLVACCWPWSAPLSVFGPDPSGRLPQWAGFLFLGLLVAYIWQSVRWARLDNGTGVAPLEEFETDVTAPVAFILARLGVCIALVIVTSHALIPTVTECAIRVQIPNEVIAATLVAFGTSLPELVTAIAAARKNHGDLAVGNVIGADILNVLFVTGAAAAVTPAGLHTSHHFFHVLFPAMIFILVTFRVGAIFSGMHLARPIGVVLLVTYLMLTVFSFANRQDRLDGPPSRPDAMESPLESAAAGE